MKTQGTLIVRVFAAQGRIPIPDATVVVTGPRAEGEKYQLEAIQKTDRSGETKVLVFQTPSWDDSQRPGIEHPYAVRDVWVEHVDYVPALVENVQIFPEVETIQNVQLIPLAEWGGGIGNMDISNITGQLL